MTSKIRDFSNFRKFGGDVVNGIYEFPKIYSIDSRNRLRFWKQYVLLTDQQNVQEEYEQNWNRDIPITPIQDVHFKSHDQLTPNIIALVFNEQGIQNMKLSRHIPTIIRTGKLVGKKNARNTFTQSLIEARSHYLKKIDNGYSLDPNNMTNDLYYAMAAHRFDDHPKKIVYPCYSQPKLDGVRCITCLKDGKIIRYSRDLNPWNGYSHWDEYLMAIFEQHPTLHIDGELYKHGKRLQEITGTARNEQKKFDLDYYVFDIFDPNTSLTFPKRNTLLNKLFKNTPTSIIVVPTKQVKDKAELDILYSQYINDKYEGQMVRMTDSLYESSVNREARSYGLFKRKKRYDAEYPLVGVLQGERGKAKGVFIGVFEAPSGKSFKASPKNITNDDARELYNTIFNNLSNYKGKMATIEYEDLSKDQVPLRPKFLQFRE